MVRLYGHVRAALTLVGMFCTLAFFKVTLADQPSISLLEPPGLRIGTESEVLIRGARLSDVTQFLSYDTGIVVSKLTTEGANKVKASIRIEDDCKPGLHAFRLATQSGVSNLRYLSVSPYPQDFETEPNSNFDEPQLVSLNTTINGVIKTEDVDYFAVELEQNQLLTVELEGLRLGTEFFDPFIAILDENRFELASSDDAPLLRQDCLCSFRPETSGTFIIEVRESSFGGNDRCQYRLHVGNFPRPVAVIPAGGRPGETIQATLVDVSGDSWIESITLPDEVGEFQFFATRDGKVAPSPNRLRVSNLRNVMENDAGDEKASAVAGETPVAFNGVLQEDGDIDWFKFKAKKNQNLRFQVYGRKGLRSPIDSWLEIHKADGGRLAANDDSGGPDSSLTYNKFPADGEYLLAIRDQLGEGSQSHAYRIEVAPPEKSLSMSISELQRYVSQTIEVPQGAQMAVRLNARRTGFRGDLSLLLANLPQGIELITPTIKANQSFIPMMLKATADAQPQAQLVALTAKFSSDGNPDVVGHLDQRTMLVRGRNNRDMWGHNSARVPVAVTRKLPFSIEVVQPRVPLVRGGSSHLKVVAHRDEGYKERIYLRSLYNPSGCSTSGSIRIEPDKNEALIPITANSKAALGTYPIAILARAKSVDANVWVSSEFVDLEIADSFFDFKFSKTVAELGNSAVLGVGLDIKRAPEGDVEFEIVGLPAGVSCEEAKLPLASDMTQLAFPIQVDENARLGQFRTVYVRATISRPNGQIVQTAGRGEIQLVKPLVTTSVAKSVPSDTPKTKPLRRLDQLRQAKKSSD